MSVLKQEKEKLCVAVANIVAALEYTGSKLTDHDHKIDDLTIVVAKLVDSVTDLNTQQDESMELLRDIHGKVSELDNAKKGGRVERGYNWESIATAIGRLAGPRPGQGAKGYRVTGSRTEFQDPNFPLKNTVRKPAEILLPID